MTARKSIRFTDDMHALGGAFIAAVVNKAMRSHQRGRAQVIVTRPERWAGGGAGRTQNALGRFIEAGALFRRLQTLSPIRRKWGVVDEIWKHLLVVIKERFHIHDQVFGNFQTKQWLDW